MKTLVSVIVAVFNAKPYLTALLDSLMVQDLDPAAFNVIAVDDGSTDGSAELLDDYGRRYANVDVIHQEHSGSPGKPRNVGLRRTHARYVFFADADDIVGAESLRRLVDFADAHDADIVIPRMVSLDGRAFPQSVYDTTRVDADLVTAFQTLFSQKLYRRRLLADHGIWFDESARFLEDGMFNAGAYVHAKRISIVSDYEYYYLRERGDGQNLSRSEKVPADYTRAVGEIGRIVRQQLGNCATADQIVLDLYRRKCLHIYDPGRFSRYDRRVQGEWIASHRDFLQRFISEAMEARLGSPYRERSYFIRRGNVTALLAFARDEAEPTVTATLASAVWSGHGLAMDIDAAIVGRLSLPRQLICEIRNRDGSGHSAFPLVRREAQQPEYGQPGRYAGVLPTPSIEALLPGTYDVHLVGTSGPQRFAARVRWTESLRPPRGAAGFQIRGTKSGNVSVKKSVVGGVAAHVRDAIRQIARSLTRRRSQR